MKVRLLPMNAWRTAPPMANGGRLFSRRLLGSLAVLAIGCFFLPRARAQTIYTRDGQVVATQGLRRDGDAVIARIQTNAGQVGELGYPIGNIARIDFPNPPQIKLAGDLLNAGKTDEASRQLTPILAYYEPFHDLPGNWWTPLALLQLDAFTRLGRDRDADAIINQLVRFGGASAETLRFIQIKQAEASERRGDHHNAIDRLDPIIKDTAAPPASLVEAWLTVGQARLALRDYKAALLAFLHVPVYAPERTLLMPQALLGSAGAYRGLDDGQRAETALKQLIASYPTSPEATEARDRLQKISAATSTHTGS